MTQVIITRPKPAIQSCATTYVKAGLKVFQAPCFDIQTNPSVQPGWLTAEADVWLVLSIHALRHALAIVPGLKPPATTRVLAVGATVADFWQQHYKQVIEYHADMNSEGVIELLSKYQPSSVKILTTGDSRPLIRAFCMNQQISYSQINTYQRVPLKIDQVSWFDLYANVTQDPVVLTATSCGILSQLMSKLSAELKAVVTTQPIVVGAIRIAELARDLGFSEVHLAASPSDKDMSEAVVAMQFRN